jgi:hypothetical protein
MNYVKISTINCLFCLFSGFTLVAQQTISTGGGDISGGGESVAYSLGQVFYTSSTGTDGSVLRGVEQPYEIFTLSITEVSNQLTFTVFPNPTAKELVITTDVLNQQLGYELYDMNSKLIQKGDISAYETTLDLNSLPASAYFLKVYQNDTQVKSFKIIKR